MLPFLPANGIILSVLLSASVASYQMVEDACSSHSRSLKAEDSLGKPFLCFDKRLCGRLWQKRIPAFKLSMSLELSGRGVD